MFTILPGAGLELDAFRINWRSFATRVVVGKQGEGQAGEVGREAKKNNKTSFAKSKSYKPPAGVVGGRLVGIVAAYVWCQEHHPFAFLLYEFHKA